MRMIGLLMAAAIVCAAQPAAARVTVVELTGVATRGTDNGHITAPSPFGSLQLGVDLSTGITTGVIVDKPFSLRLEIDDTRGGLDLYPSGQDRYGSGDQSPVSAVFTLNGFSYAFGNAYGQVSKGFGPIDSFYVFADESRLRPPMFGAFTEVVGSLQMVLNLKSQVFTSAAFEEPASWTRGPDDQAFGSLTLSLQDTNGSPFVYLEGPERTAGLELRFDTLKVLAPPPGPGAVPEPSTWLVMILGFGAAGAGLRRAARSRRLAA